jgi:hypothetical protein
MTRGETKMCRFGGKDRRAGALDWVATQNNLGTALRTLGECESGTARLKEAVAAWDGCLMVTAPVWPPEWVQYVRDRRDETPFDQATVSKINCGKIPDFRNSRKI